MDGRADVGNACVWERVVKVLAILALPLVCGCATVDADVGGMMLDCEYRIRRGDEVSDLRILPMRARSEYAGDIQIYRLYAQAIDARCSKR